jgi:hypothetical protein
MVAQFVAPYRKRGKNDANDADAICEAVGRPNMHFVTIKSEEQQSVLMVHRARTLAVANRTAEGSRVKAIGICGPYWYTVREHTCASSTKRPMLRAPGRHGSRSVDT